MAKVYAPLPFSYLSAGAPAPRMGLRKDEGLYGSRADANKGGLAVTPEQQSVYGEHSIDRRLPIGGRVAAFPKAPTIPESDTHRDQDETYNARFQPDVDYDGRRQEQQRQPGTRYGNFQQSEIEDTAVDRYPIENKVPTMPRAVAPNVYGNVQQSDVEYSARAYAPDVRDDASGRPSTMYPPTSGHVVPRGNQIYESMEFNDRSRTDGVRIKPDSNEHPGIFDNFILKGPVRAQPEVLESLPNGPAGSRGQQLHEFFENREPQFQRLPPDNQAISKPTATGNAFDRPDYRLYAGYPSTGNGPMSNERSPETPTDATPTRPDQAFQSSGTILVDKRRDDSEEDCPCCCSCSGSCCSCGCSRVCWIVIAVIVAMIVCLGAGFIAGWFGHQAFIAASSSAQSPASTPTVLPVATVNSTHLMTTLKAINIGTTITTAAPVTTPGAADTTAIQNPTTT